MSTQFADKSRSLRTNLNGIISNIRSLRQKRLNRRLTNIELGTKLRVIRAKLFMVNRGVLSAQKDFRRKIRALKIPADIQPPANLMEHLTRNASGKLDVDVNNYPKISVMDRILNGLKDIQTSRNQANRAMRSAERQNANLSDLDKLLRNAQEIGNAINGGAQPRPQRTPPVRPRSRSANNARPRRSPNAGELRRQLGATPEPGNRRRSA